MFSLINGVANKVRGSLPPSTNLLPVFPQSLSDWELIIITSNCGSKLNIDEIAEYLLHLSPSEMTLTSHANMVSVLMSREASRVIKPHQV